MFMGAAHKQTDSFVVIHSTSHLHYTKKIELRGKMGEIKGKGILMFVVWGGWGGGGGGG